MRRSRDEDRLAFSERLTRAWEMSGRPDYGKFSALARVFDVTPSAVRRWFEGDTIPTSRIGPLADYLGVRAEWLLSNNGPMREVEAKYSDGAIATVEIHRLPIIRPDEYADHVEGTLSVSSQCLAIGKFSKQSFAFEILDNSLLPEAVSGMIAAVDPEEWDGKKVRLSKRPVVVLDNGSFLAGKYIVFGEPMIEPINRDFKPVQLTDEHKVIGEIVAFTQRDI